MGKNHASQYANFGSLHKKEIIGFEDDFFNDWAKVLFFKTGLQQIEFTNPILNHLLLK